jgi:hypothetical protein
VGNLVDIRAFGGQDILHRQAGTGRQQQEGRNRGADMDVATPHGVTLKGGFLFSVFYYRLKSLELSFGYVCDGYVFG